MSSPAFPEPPRAANETSFGEIDRLLEGLSAQKQAWLSVDRKERIALLSACMTTTHASRNAWAEAGARAKGGEAESAIAGEVLLGGVTTTIRNMRLLIRALKADGQPKVPKSWQTVDGQRVVQVFPTDTWDGLLFAGWKGETWIEPGKPASQGAIYRAKAAGESGEGRVELVLGAGNVSSIGPMDALHKLFVEDEVVVLKTNPVNAYLAPIWADALAPLIEAGVLAIVSGGTDVGKYLCQHAAVDTIHITGSDKTHDAIVWGVDAQDVARRKAAHEPINERPITSELGCVTPTLVVPGPWSDADIDFQARQVAGMVAHNASFNCNACKVLLLPAGWDQRDAFVANRMTPWTSYCLIKC